MRLSAVLAGVTAVRQQAAPDTAVSSLAYDSRRAGPGALFFAIPGFKADGHDFAAGALHQGVAAIVTERWLEGVFPQVQVGNARLAMAAAAANFYGHPSRKLGLTAVTGTNGKTTTTFLIDSILKTAGNKTGLIGGIEYRIGGSLSPAKRTTPEAPDLERALAQMVDAGAGYGTIEASSHGVDLFRTACLRLAVVVFTNLTPDHLDLHGDMESYFRTKRRLFFPEADEAACLEGGPPPLGAVNLDDAYGRRLYHELGPERALGYGIGETAAVHAVDVRERPWGTDFTLRTPAGAAPVSLHLPGSHNLENALAAAAGSLQLDISPDDVAAGISALASVPGRLEPVETAAPFSVVVDYAHNEDGLKCALTTARSLTSGRLIIVFGCPGERDRDKRPRMGRIAGTLADLAILTTDDCYGEPPEQILDEAEPGLAASGGDYRRIASRREAIAAALAAAVAGDLVLIAGKGHEKSQILAGGPVPFDDREVVLELTGSELSGSS